MIRCPLPPFNADPDTLRQFETGQVPQIRFLPLSDPGSTPPPPRNPAVGTSSGVLSLQVVNAIATQALATAKAALAASGGGGFVPVTKNLDGGA
jgi:hypothetical protein